MGLSRAAPRFFHTAREPWRGARVLIAGARGFPFDARDNPRGVSNIFRDLREVHRGARDFSPRAPYLPRSAPQVPSVLAGIFLTKI